MVYHAQLLFLPPQSRRRVHRSGAGALSSLGIRHGSQAKEEEGEATRAGWSPAGPETSLEQLTVINKEGWTGFAMRSLLIPMRGGRWLSARRLGKPER